MRRLLSTGISVSVSQSPRPVLSSQTCRPGPAPPTLSFEWPEWTGIGLLDRTGGRPWREVTDPDDSNSAATWSQKQPNGAVSRINGVRVGRRHCVAAALPDSAARRRLMRSVQGSKTGLSQGLSYAVWVLALGLALAPIRALGAGGAKGAYCPLPEPGQTPQCLDPARKQYELVFEALDDGAINDEQLENLEADVADGAGSDHAYLALNSITWVYYRIAQQAAAAPGGDPEVVARLDRLNRLLSSAYEASADSPQFQTAMLDAARDLQNRAPKVSIECLDEAGLPAECSATEALLRGYAAASSEIGIRGALQKLLERAGGDGS